MDVSQAEAIKNLPALTGQTKAIQALALKTAVNNFTLPEGFYRADLLPADIDLATLSPLSPDIAVAYQPLSYVEGYPTLDGNPFWAKLPHEHHSAYTCFEVYLDQGKQGARQLYKVLEDDRVTSLPQVVKLSDIQEWFHLYYWVARSRASDLFYTAHRQRMRAMRAIEAEDDQYIIAERLLNLCCNYLDENEDELKENMTPKAFTELLKTAVGMQRVSLSLPLNGGAKTDESAPSVTSIEMAMRQVVQRSGMAVESHNDTAQAEETRVSRLHELMANPETLKLAQELVVRITSGPKEPSKPEILPVN